MKVEQLIPQPLDRVSFKLSSFKQVPNTAGCYVLATFADDILYIGLSNNLHNRFQQHLNNSEKTNPNNEGKAIWFYYILCDDNNLPRLERSWLNQFEIEQGELPILNKIRSPLD